MPHTQTSLFRDHGVPAWLSDLLDAARITVTSRPRTRDDCLPGGSHYRRPCPWVSCRYHAATVEDEHGNLRGAHEISTVTGRKTTWPKGAEPISTELYRVLGLAQIVTDGRHTCLLEGWNE